jgi:hypothetical protein
MASGVTGIIEVPLNWLLRGFPGSALALGLLVSALYFFIGVKLLQLRYWALVAGRILALWSAAGWIALIATRRLADGPPVVSLLRLADIIISAAIVITIFLPSVSKTLRRPNKAETA